VYGHIVLNEWLLSSNYESVWSPYESEHDVDSANRVMRLGHKTHVTLCTDDDPYYSYLNPPKRAVPLFTSHARDSFVAYAAARGFNYSRLPADRNEFNDDDSTVQLPSWVQFVDLTDAQYWNAWTDWVYQTWTTYVDQDGDADVDGADVMRLPNCMGGANQPPNCLGG